MNGYFSRALALVCGAALLGFAALHAGDDTGRGAKGEETKPLVRQLRGIDAVGFGKTTEITTEKEFAQAFGEKAVALNKGQVDFTREKVVFVTWTGSGSSSLHFAVKRDKGKIHVVLAIETSNPATADHQLKGAAVAMPKDATWGFGKVERLLPGETKDKAKTAARLKGMRAALADLDKGVLKQKSFPLPDPAWFADYLRLLKKECGVDWETVDNPPETEALLAEMGGYNDVMRVEIEHRYGKGILEKLHERAMAEYFRSLAKE